jgi:hypothetical protein
MVPGPLTYGLNLHYMSFAHSPTPTLFSNIQTSPLPYCEIYVNTFVQNLLVIHESYTHHFCQRVLQYSLSTILICAVLE